MYILLQGKRITIFKNTKRQLRGIHDLIVIWNISAIVYIAMYFQIIFPKILRVGIAGAIFDSLSTRNILTTGAGAYLTMLLSSIGAIMMMASYGLTYVYKKKHIYFSVGIIIIINIFTGSRGTLVYLFVNLLIADKILLGNISKTKILVIIVISVIFSVWYGAARSGLSVELSVESVFSETLKRFDSFDNMMREGDIIINNNYYFGGRSIIDFLMQPIPRDFMPEKPLLFTSRMTKDYLPNIFSNNVTYDFPGILEAILNFGILPGIFLFSAFSVVLIKVMQYVYNRASISFFHFSIYISFYQLSYSFQFQGWIDSNISIGLIIGILNFILIRNIIFCKAEQKINYCVYSK
jgi:oligosaccharide repeat unit polymerase